MAKLNGIVEDTDQVSIENAVDQPKRKLNRYQILNIVLISLLVALALGVGIYYLVKALDKPDPVLPVLTPENYEQVVVDMSYDDVIDIFGAGKRTEASGANEVDYIWQDNGGRIMIITFKANKTVAGLVPTKVLEKAQYGIIAETPTV